MMIDNAPIGHTCPDIDKVITEIIKCIKTLKGAIKYYEMDKEAINDIENVIWELDDLTGRNSILEKLRNQNEELREWGNELYSELQDYKLKESDIINYQTNNNATNSRTTYTVLQR